jgi:hypothetical protein
MREPTMAEMEDLFFAWGVAKYVKSNAIVLVREDRTIGIADFHHMAAVGTSHSDRVKSLQEIHIFLAHLIDDCLDVLGKRSVFLLVHHYDKCG